jgi:hypothetical protein
MSNIVEIQNSPTGFYFIASPGRVLELLPDGSVFVPMTAAEQIESFGALQVGWDYGSGGAVEKMTIDAAHTWNRLLTMIGFETNASPGSEGEVAIGGSCGPFYLEVIVESDQTTSVAYDVGGNEEFYRLNQSAIGALSSVLDATGSMGSIWNAYTSFTQSNTIPQNASGIGMLLRTIKDHYQYSSVGALQNRGALNANTYEYFGGNLSTSAASHQSFGNSTLTGSQVMLGSALAAPKSSAITSSNS